MVFSRRRRFKRSFKRRSYRKKRRSPKASRLFAKKVKRIINKTVETKYVEAADFTSPYSFSITNYPCPDPVFTPLRYIGQGVLKNQRLGAKIYVKGVRLTGHLQGGSSSTTAVIDDAYNYLRAVMFWGPAGLDTTSAFLTGKVPNWHQVYRKETFPIIQRIKKDKKLFFRNPIVGPTDTGVDYDSYERPFNWYFPVNKTVTYIGDGLNNTAKSDLYLYFISDSSFVPHPAMKWWKMTITFTDA